MAFRRLYKIVGFKALYLSICKRLAINPRPVRIPMFGEIRTLHEIQNLDDNFAKEAMRDETVEKYLASQKAPCVVDCGVNVGITVRWWFHLNPAARVIGIDMIPETHAFTAAALKTMGIDASRYQPVTAALWSENGKEFTFNVQDPLQGDNSLSNAGAGAEKRVVKTRTLDDILKPENLRSVELLKIDLEGAGGQALLGAEELLKKTKHVFFETHGEEESKLASKILTRNGFLLRRATHREHFWWEKE
jgi:FkbM family methyltransferase